MHVSNFRPGEAGARLHSCFARVRKEVDAELLMAGDGPDRGPAERLAWELGVNEAVKFLGKQDHLERLIPHAHVLHLPSETEAFGLAALEAMACGVPPVATRTGGVPDLITHGVDGFMEPVGDHAAQAGRIIELLDKSATAPQDGRSRPENCNHPLLHRSDHSAVRSVLPEGMRESGNCGGTSGV